MKRKTALNLVVSLMLALSLAACGGGSTTPTNPNPNPPTGPDEPGAPTPKEISGTIAGWTLGEAVVRAAGYNLANSETTVLEEGTISADGSFSLTLPVGEDIPAGALYTVNEASFCSTEEGQVSTVEVTPSGPFDLASNYFIVYDSTGSDYLGNIFPGSGSFETSYGYEYVASDVAVTGDCVYASSNSGGGFFYTTKYDLNYKAGWNEVIAASVEEGMSYSTGSIPADGSWYYSGPPCEASDLEPVYEVAPLISIPVVAPVVGVDLNARPAHSPPPC